MSDQLNSGATFETTQTLKRIHTIHSSLTHSFEQGGYDKDDYNGQMILGNVESLTFPEICLAGEEKPPKYLAQETCPDRGSNLGSLRGRRACYRLLHSGGLNGTTLNKIKIQHNML